ncbi:MAG: RNA-binding S4 domain-containing protein [Bacillota bacterium]
MREEEVFIRGDHIALDALLKWSGAVDTGGRAKTLIQSGMIKLNGVVETRRSSKVSVGSVVDAGGLGVFRVCSEDKRK